MAGQDDAHAREPDQVSARAPEHEPARGPDPERARRALSGRPLARLAPWLLVLASLVHLRALHAPFVFDDTISIVHNEYIESLWPLARALDAPTGTCADGRPLVALSLAVNYALGGRQVEGYHLFNVLVHALVSLALYALARTWMRTLGLDRRLRVAWAFVLALLWSVHPLVTSTLDHVVYRNEALMALAFLCTLLGALRGFEAERASGARRACFLFALLACLLGTGCKEVIVGAPLAVWLLDRSLVSHTFGRALRAHRWLYLGLFGSWLLLFWIVRHGERGESVGLELEGLSPRDYLLTQGGVILHYLRLALWPSGLCLDYDDWPIARSLADALPAAAIVAALAGLALALAWRRSQLGLLATLALLVLAPSSSVIPLAGAIAGEHRMYLPLAAVLALSGLALVRSAPRLAGDARLVLALALLAVPLGWATLARHDDYASTLRIWQETTRQRPRNARAWNSLGAAWRAAGQNEAAIAAYRRALELRPKEFKALINLGNLEYEAGELEAARHSYGRAAALRPDVAETRYYLGSIQIAQGAVAEGVSNLRAALSPAMSEPGLLPELRVPARQMLAWALATSARETLRDPEQALRLALELDRETGGKRPRLLATLAAAQAAAGRFEEALASIERAISIARGAGRPSTNFEAQRELYARGRPTLEGAAD